MHEIIIVTMLYDPCTNRFVKIILAEGQGYKNEYHSH